MKIVYPVAKYDRALSRERVSMTCRMIGLAMPMTLRKLLQQYFISIYYIFLRILYGTNRFSYRLVILLQLRHPSLPKTYRIQIVFFPEENIVLLIEEFSFSPATRSGSSYNVSSFRVSSESTSALSL